MKARRGTYNFPSPAIPDGPVGQAMHEVQFVSLKELAIRWQCSRTTAARWLRDAGIRGFYFGHGRNGAVRFMKADIERFLKSLERDE